MTWLNLAIAASQASAEVALVCIAGAVLARYGVFTQEVQRSMAKANMYLFTPCLLFVKIAATVTAEKFVELWPVPVSFIVFALLGYFLAQLGSCLLRLSQPQKRLAIVSMIFSNSNSLPIALMQSLSLSPSVRILFWGDNDTPDDVVARGMTYIMFFGLVGNFVRWSYGYDLIGKGDEEVPTIVESSSPEISSPGTASTKCGSCNGSINNVTFDEENPRDDGDDDTSPLIENAHAASCQCSGGPTMKKPDFLRRLGLLFQHAARKLCKGVLKFCASLLTPPLMTTLVALFVGLVEPLRNLLFGPNAPLRPSLTAAIDQCGEAAVPLILLSLGAQLANLPKPKTKTATPQDRQSSPSNEVNIDGQSEGLSPRSTYTGPIPSPPMSAPVSPLNRPLNPSPLASEVSLPTAIPSGSSFIPRLSRPSSLRSFRPSLRAKSFKKVPNYRTIGLVIFGRLVISPLIATPLIFAMRPYFGVLGNDPVFLLVLIILGSAPTAINLMQICQVHAAFEADMARLLLVSYICAVPIMTAVIMVAMGGLESLATIVY